MITRAEFAEENRRIAAHKKAGKSDDWCRGWLRKWREAGEVHCKPKSKRELKS